MSRFQNVRGRKPFHRPRRRRAVFVIIALSTAVLAELSSAVAQAPVPQVSITGGADPSGHQYRWTVTNRASSPVVLVEFPHTQADLFLAPAGWKIRNTNLINVGVKSDSGVCRATVESSADGIDFGESAEFSMRIAPAGALRGVGNVRVRWADGTESWISGVELPIRPPRGETFTSLIALGAIFLGFVAVAAWRRKRRPVGR